MCKVGGPRCPQSNGKRIKHNFSQSLKRNILKEGYTVEDWKETNLEDYDRKTREAFSESGHSFADRIEEVRANDDSGYDPQGAFWSVFANQEPEEESEPEHTESESEEFSHLLKPPEVLDPDLISDDPAVVNAYMQALEAQWREDFYSERETEDREAAAYWREMEEEAEAAALSQPEPHPSNKHLLPEDAVIDSPTPNPVFVYGTLRSGQGNYNHILLGKTQREVNDVTLPGGKMYSNGGLPYVLEDDDSQVVGDLMYLDYDHLNNTMQELDWLEGTDGIRNDDNLYDRTLKYVHVGDNKYVQAWVYVPPAPDQANIAHTTAPVESGDWLNR